MKQSDVKEIIIHCSATREGDDSINAEVIDRWHKERGWKGIGYHYVVLMDGTIETGRMVDQCGAHTKGHNKNSIGICYAGGVDSEMIPEDNRTSAQIASLLLLLRLLKNMFPTAIRHGHRDFSPKACPSFDATKEYKGL